jgi:hypothetical protein
MFCPKCGQQQLSDNASFCSRCGLRLNAVGELLRTDGLPALRTPDDRAKVRFIDRKGMRSGAKLVFYSFLLFFLAMGVSIALDSPGPLLIPFVVFVAGMAQLIYGRIFGEALFPEQLGKKKSYVPPQEPRPLFGKPESEPIPASFSSNRVNTAQIVEPPSSVTEHTTRMLNND